MPTILLIILGVLLIYVHQFNLNLEIQPLINSDSFVHYKQLLVMFEGFKHVDPVAFFSFNFNYGFPYFLSNFIVSLPALFSGSHPHVVYSVRLFASAMALLTLVFLYKTLRFRLQKLPALLLTAVIPCTPFFWIASGWFRADWMMSALFMISVFYCFKSLEQKPRLASRYFWVSSFFYYIAFSVKTQAVILLPFYLFWMLVRNLEKPLRLCREIPRWIAFMGLTYIVTNPHILHPAGFYGITRRFGLEFTFFTQDHHHGLAMLSFWDKLHYWDIYFFPAILMIAILLVSWTLLTREWLKSGISHPLKMLASNQALFSDYILSKTTAVNLIYLYGISVVFPWKFLIPLTPLVLLQTTPILTRCSQKIQITLTAMLLGITILTHLQDYPRIFCPENIQKRPQVLAQEAFVSAAIKPYLYLNSVILTDPYIIIDYRHLGIPHTHIELFWENPIPQIDETQFNQKWSRVSRYHVKTFREKSVILLKKPVLADILNKIPSHYMVVAQNKDLLILANIAHFSR